MKVSAIILTYNRAHMLTEAIDSVLNQTFKDFEVIVVDNYSSDNTEAVVKSYNDKRIKYFKNQNNGFIGVNRNYGVEKSRGEYITFLDDDDLWLSEKLERQVELLDSNKELGLVYSDSYMINGDGNVRENTYFHGVNPVRGSAFNELFMLNVIPMLTVVIKREVLDKVGVFNPRYKIALDHDLWLRVVQYYPIDFIEQPLAKYRLYSDSVSQKNINLTYQEELQIIDYWLKRNPGLERELGSKIKWRKAAIYRAMLSIAIRHILRDRNMASIKGLGKLLRYLMLPRR
ncbi:glycosyltransferase family 2 protein [Chloroflexota bacterium]